MEHLAEYTEEEFQEMFALIAKTLVVKIAGPSPDNPQACLVGGQSGAGKTTLIEEISENYHGTAVVINGDEYRKYHPRFKELFAQYGPDCAVQTAKWAGKMVEALIQYFSDIKYNLIIEGTFRDVNVPLTTAQALIEKGYSVDVAVMAVKPEVSYLSCELRCLQMKEMGTAPRSVEYSHHQKIVDNLVSNFSQLEQSGKFSEIIVYSRDREYLFRKSRDGVGAADALEKTLFGEWTEEERRHYQKLEQQKNELEKRIGCRGLY